MKQDDALKETRELIKEESIKYKAKVTSFIKNWSVITTFSVIILSYIQYTYKYGICKAFSLPINTVSIRLTDYIPAVALLCCIGLYVFDCFMSLHPQRGELKRNSRFSFFRILWGAATIFLTLYLILDGNMNHLLRYILSSVIPPLIIEFLLGTKIRARIKEAFEKPFRLRLANKAQDRPFYQYYLKPALTVLVVIILLIPLASENIAKHKTGYEICKANDEIYAKVLDYVSDEVIVLPASIEGDSLTIYTGTYKFVSRSDADGFVFQLFDHVTITETSPTD